MNKIVENKTLIDTFSDIWKNGGLDVRDVNPFGIRNFDNLMGGVWNDTVGFWEPDRMIFVAKGTVDPSPYYIREHPMNPAGTGVMCHGPHKNTHCVGPHGKTGYTALVNTHDYNPKCQPQDLWRVDRDGKFIMENGSPKIFSGYFGANIHHGNAYAIEDHIGAWSAACQVFQDIKDFNILMDAVLSSEMYKADKACLFNYYLFDKNEMPVEVIIL